MLKKDNKKEEDIFSDEDEEDEKYQELYPCKKCNKTFIQYSYRNVHYRREHENREIASPEHKEKIRVRSVEDINHEYYSSLICSLGLYSWLFTLK